MPFSGKSEYSHGIQAYFWEMTEDSGCLQAMCAECGLPANCEAKAESRRREILVERLLLRQIFSENTSLEHNADLAPHLAGTDSRISIAHARGRLCIAVSPTITTFGIDLETYRPLVLKVRTGYLSDGERRWIGEADVMAHLVAWTAKEAVFKAISDRSLVSDYSNQIVLSPYKLDEKQAVELMNGVHPGSCDTLTISHEARFQTRSYRLFTEISAGYIFTLAVEL